MPGKFHGQKNLADDSLCGHKESDTTKYIHTQADTHTHTYIVNMNEPRSGLGKTIFMSRGDEGT